MIHAARQILGRIQRWNQQRVAHCTFCGATSERMFGNGAERVATNHTRFTGHVNVTVRRPIGSRR